MDNVATTYSARVLGGVAAPASSAPDIKPPADNNDYKYNLRIRGFPEATENTRKIERLNHNNEMLQKVLNHTGIGDVVAQDLFRLSKLGSRPNQNSSCEIYVHRDTRKHLS